MLTQLEKRLVISVCLLSRFLAAAVYSLQAPFFPHEAEQKQITPGKYGLVFSIYEVVALVTAPIVGANIHRIGIKFGICCGLFIAAYACILFGFLTMVPDNGTFITLAIIIRIFEAVGQSSSSVCTLTLLATSFPDTANTKLAYTGTAFSSGMIAGPAIGGVLFAAGGFLLPFVSVGAFLFLCLIIAIKIFPSSRVGDQADAKGLTIFLLKKNGIHVGLCTIFCCTISIGFLAATLEPHLRKFNYSPGYTSLFFLITPLIFAITNRFPAKAIDKHVDPRKVAIVGAGLKIVSFCFIGPFPWLSVEPNPYLVVIGLILNGLSNSCQIIPGLGQLLRTGSNLNFPSGDQSNAVISGFFQVSISLGLSIGPLLGGMSLQLIDFRKGLLFIIVIHMFLIIFCTHSIHNYPIAAWNQQANPVQETQPLLERRPSSGTLSRSNSDLESDSGTSNESETTLRIVKCNTTKILT